MDRKEVGDDLLYLGVPPLDDVMLGRDCFMCSWPSSSLTSVEVRNVMGGRAVGVPFDEEMVAVLRSVEGLATSRMATAAR
jgi:hypothetical protein